MIRTSLDQPEGESIPDRGKSRTKAQRSDRTGSVCSRTRRHVRVSDRGKGRRWGVSRAWVMGAPPTRLKWLHFIQGVMGATGRGAPTFHQDPSGGGLAGAKEAVGRMDVPSRPEGGSLWMVGTRATSRSPAGYRAPTPESSERDYTLESGEFESPLARIMQWLVLALTVNSQSPLCLTAPRGRGLGP